MSSHEVPDLPPPTPASGVATRNRTHVEELERLRQQLADAQTQLAQHITNEAKLQQELNEAQAETSAALVTTSSRHRSAQLSPAQSHHSDSGVDPNPVTNSRSPDHVLGNRSSTAPIREHRETTTLSQGSVDLLDYLDRSRDLKINAPEKFTGERAKLPQFITQVRMYTSLQPKLFRSEESKVLFAASYLRDVPFNWFESYYSQAVRPLWMHDLDSFTNELRQSFGDPDRQGTAARNLSKLRQDRSVTEYYALFKQYAIEAKWDEEVQKYFFKNGLKSDIQDALAFQVDEPPTLQDLAALATRLDIRRTERLERQVRFKSHNNSSVRPDTSSATNTASTTDKPSTPHEVITRTTQNRPPASTRDSSGRRKLTDEQKKYRDDHGLCRYCGEKGHIATNCPNRPESSKTRKPQSKFNSVTTHHSAPTPTTPLPGDSGNGEALLRL